jgi:hypothetical protein
MPGESATIGHLFVIRWDTVVYSDLAVLVRDVRAISEKTGRLVTYIAIQDDDYREPPAEVKQAFKHWFPELMKFVKTDYLVISATGIQASLQRSILKAMLISGRITRMPYLDRIVILDTVEEVLRREAADLPAPASEILTALREKGVLRAKIYT